jgi:hypothetical protein
MGVPYRYVPLPYGRACSCGPALDVDDILDSNRYACQRAWVAAVPKRRGLMLGNLASPFRIDKDPGVDLIL